MQAWWTEAMLDPSADQRMVSALIEGYNHVTLQALPGACMLQWWSDQKPQLITLVLLQQWALALFTV